MNTGPRNDSSFTVGVFTAELIDSYQAKLWEGIVSAAEKRGIGLISFLGSRVNSPIPQEASSNTIYRMAGTDNIDGLIIISSAISTYLEYSEVVGLFKQHGDVPRVSVGLEIPGIPSITVNGSDGLEYLISHLVTEHSRKHFACIAGPPGHKESESRKNIIFSTLDRYGLSIDPDCIEHGTFEKESGKNAVSAILDKKKPIDALICLNDKMALAAMEELVSRGMNIPDDISVIGFDGLEEAECSPVPLTTVRQPLSEVGAAAIEAVCDLMETGRAGNTTLECNPVIAESCGCRQRLVPSDEELHCFRASMSAIEKHFYTHLKQYISSSPETDNSNEISKLIEESSISLKRIHTIICLILSEAENSGPQTAGGWQIFAHALTSVSELQNRQNAVLRLSLRERFAAARSVGISLSEAFEFPAILSRLNGGLERLGFHKAFLVLFSGSDEKGKMYEFPTSGKYTDGHQFSTHSILPDPLQKKWKKGIWVLVPLVFQSEPLGYLILPAHLSDSAIYDALSKQIASTLKGTQLLDRVRLHEKNLEKEVNRRTSELRDEISRRIRLEQEVIDISNNTMNRIGQDLHDDLCQHLAGISMITTALQNTFPETDNSYTVAGQINDLIVESIDRTKGIVRGLVPPGLKEQGLAVAVEALTEAVSRSYRIPVQFEKNEHFDVRDPDTALQLYRIIQEALSNSVKHSGCSAIRVQLFGEEYQFGNGQGNLIIRVEDNGRGLPENNNSSGMGQKIMRYRAEKANAVLSFENNSPNGAVVSCIIPAEGR